jgi:hypothetical protein
MSGFSSAPFAFGGETDFYRSGAAAVDFAPPDDY